MAKNQVVMPQMGESITSGTITKWHKAPGDTVAIDEILLEISTDKVESEIPSPFEGRLEEILFGEGETVAVGVAIAVLEDSPGETPSPGPAPTPEPQGPSVPPSPGKKQKNRFYTPLVRTLAKERGIELSELEGIQGSGAGGRVNRADFLAYAEKRKETPPPSPEKQEILPPPGPKASSGRVEIVPMDNMRKMIAKNMAASKAQAPHVNSFDEIDMTNLVKFRESAKEDFKREEGFSLTYTHFILYVLAQALRKFPEVNASLDGDNIILKKDINLGCAVAVPGSGLLVPVIKNADSLNLTGIARNLNDLVLKARSKKLTLEDISGGTYSFTNNGSFGILAATPVILLPQVGIFCVGTIKKRPIIMEDNSLAIRHIMVATHTYDHRLIDGELGSRFLRHVVEALEAMDPSTLF